MEDGFTLIEVLAALLIFSLSVIGLAQANTQSLKTVAYLDQKLLAGIVADNQLALARIAMETSPSTPRSRKGQSRQMNQNFEYEVQSKPTELAGYYELIVSVKAADADQVLITRTAYKALK